MAFSYQHEYHAGNHADVFKHITLTLILKSLCKKEKPFTVIDSHSGAGRFSLDDERLLKTGEASGGIQKLITDCTKCSVKEEIPESIKDYLEIEQAYVSKNLYAGSPEIERMFLREKDTLHLVEKHPQALASLTENMKLPLIKKDGQKECEGSVHIHAEDSYRALKALTPPLIKRGLILCDPSFEDASDYKSVTETLSAVHKKWNTAVIALWYPLIARRKNETAQMLIGLEDAVKLNQNPAECFRSELTVCSKELMNEETGSHLYGSGMFIINPPWQLKEQMEDARIFLENTLKF